MRRSLRAPLCGLLVVAAGILVGCTPPDNTPEEYGGATEDLFRSACTQSYSVTGATIATSDFCKCAYEVFEENVPASDKDKNELRKDKFAGYQGKTFRDIDRELKNDPAKINDATVVPADVQTKIKACPGYGSTGEVIAPASTGAPVGPTVPATGSTGSSTPS